MPVTPYHLGPGLFFGVLLNRFVDLFSFLLGNVILDLEPGVLILLNWGKPYLSYSHHRFFHTILGALALCLIFTLILNRFKKRIYGFLKKLRLAKKIPSFGKIFFSLFLGTLTHLFFDSLMHYDVFPFWPSKYNPFLRLIDSSQNYTLCLVLGGLGVLLFFWRIIKKK